MEYLKDFGFEDKDIQDLKDTYGSRIIDELTEEKDKIYETLLFLKNYGFQNISEIVKYRIEILLESTEEVKEKIMALDREKLLKLIDMDLEILDKLFE